jgi:hypothetical protein
MAKLPPLPNGPPGSRGRTSRRTPVGSVEPASNRVWTEATLDVVDSGREYPGVPSDAAPGGRRPPLRVSSERRDTSARQAIVIECRGQGVANEENARVVTLLARGAPASDATPGPLRAGRRLVSAIFPRRRPADYGVVAVGTNQSHRPGERPATRHRSQRGLARPSHGFGRGWGNGRRRCARVWPPPSLHEQD